MAKNFKENASGYYDDTAYKAMSQVRKEQKEEQRFHKVLGLIFDVCNLSGFHIEGRITLVDEKTGRVWR